MEARGTKKCYQNSFLSDLLFMQENIQVNLKKNYKIDIVWQHILVSKNNYEIIYGWLKMTVATNTLVFLVFVGTEKIYLLINWPLYAWLMVQPGRNFWGFEGDSLIMVFFCLVVFSVLLVFVQLSDCCLLV